MRHIAYGLCQQLPKTRLNKAWNLQREQKTSQLFLQPSQSSIRWAAQAVVLSSLQRLWCKPSSKTTLAKQPMHAAIQWRFDQTCPFFKSHWSMEKACVAISFHFCKQPSRTSLHWRISAQMSGQPSKNILPEMPAQSAKKLQPSRSNMTPQ